MKHVHSSKVFKMGRSQFFFYLGHITFVIKLVYIIEKVLRVEEVIRGPLIDEGHVYHFQNAAAAIQYTAKDEISLRVLKDIYIYYINGRRST